MQTQSKALSKMAPSSQKGRRTAQPPPDSPSTEASQSFNTSIGLPIDNWDPWDRKEEDAEMAREMRLAAKEQKARLKKKGK